ncbi:uncharacterized protein CLUP02_04492, partial [Colletotrichum lupini]
ATTRGDRGQPATATTTTTTHTTRTPVAHTPTRTLHAHSRLTDINIAPTFPFPVHSRPVPAMPSYASLFRRHLDTDDDNDDYDFDKQRPRPPITDHHRSTTQVSLRRPVSTSTTTHATFRAFPFFHFDILLFRVGLFVFPTL